MGGVDSKLTEFLIEGNQDKALELYNKDETIKEQINPNARLSKSPLGDTPLHCAARHGMHQLLDILLKKGGNPHIANKKKKTAFHLVCEFSQSIASSRKSKARKAMLLTLLEHSKRNGVTSKGSHQQQCATNGVTASLFNKSLIAQDESLNTPLHLACASGLLECVELLVANDAPLFVTNIDRQMPCDVAARAKHVVIAQLLESKMVFAESKGAHRRSKFSCTRPEKTLLDTDQMIELKQQLVQSVCGRLNISYFAAEALLMSHGWSEDLVVEAFKADQDQALNKAGISVTDMMSTVDSTNQACRSLSDAVCEVCTESLTTDAVKLQCGHNSCEDCMKGYLAVRIQDGGGHNIQCPGEKCCRPVPSSVVERLVSKELNSKYTQFDIRTFVDTNQTTKWCPHVECEGVVHLPPQIIANSNQGVNEAVTGNIGINVECANGHLFCWSCHGSPHEPCDCDVWQRWVMECSNMNVSDGQILKLTGPLGEAAANIKWILQNSKPCPKCNSPIQKNDGCNHISCSKCHYDFCWVCLDKWSLHNYKTGGYFMCNRYKQIEKAEAKLEKQQEARARELKAQAKHQAEEHKQKFEQHYMRYSNHLQNGELERQLLKHSQEKTKHLAAMATVAEKRVDRILHRSKTMPVDHQTRPCVSSEDFLSDIIRTLIYSRHILAISYVISYFIVDNTEATNHRHMQAILEEQVEEISQAINRPHLRTPKSELIKMAKNLDSSLDAYKSRMNKTHRKLISLEENGKNFSVVL